MKKMKISEYAKIHSLSYRTVWQYCKDGHLPSETTPKGTILVLIEDAKERPVSYAVYCRVSSSRDKNNLERQKQRLVSYCNAKGYKVSKVVTEIGSGLNDSRKQLIDLLSDQSITTIVVEHKDRFSRFGFNMIELLLNQQGRTIEVVNAAETDKEDLMQDLVSIITSFVARLYGQRRSKRKTEKIIEQLKSEQ